MTLSSFLRAALVSLALALLASAPARAQPRVASEAELKVAFIYRIALFVEWPADLLPAAAAFQVCTVNTDAGWAAAFAALDGKRVQGRLLAPLRALARAEDARGCHVLFLPESEGRKHLSGMPGLLTMGESEGFVAAGGVVGFVREGSQMRFDINRDAATRAQLRLPAELLKVARRVVDTGGARP